MVKKLLLGTTILFIIVFSQVEAQVTVGVYKGNFYSQLGIGTNPDKKFYGEGRLFAGDFVNPFLGIEGIGQYNFIRSDWYNFSGGILLGYSEFEDGKVGLQSMLSIKPIEGHRNLAIILEAAPFYSGYETFALRANLGIRYTFIKNRE